MPYSVTRALSHVMQLAAAMSILPYMQKRDFFILTKKFPLVHQNHLNTIRNNKGKSSMLLMVKRKDLQGKHSKRMEK